MQTNIHSGVLVCSLNSGTNIKNDSCRLVLSYRLVAKQDVHIRHDLHQGLFKELTDERRREVHAEDLVVLRGVLGHFQDGLRGHGQEEALQTGKGGGGVF